MGHGEFLVADCVCVHGAGIGVGNERRGAQSEADAAARGVRRGGADRADVHRGDVRDSHLGAGRRPGSEERSISRHHDWIGSAEDWLFGNTRGAAGVGRQRWGCRQHGGGDCAGAVCGGHRSLSSRGVWQNSPAVEDAVRFDFGASGAILLLIQIKSDTVQAAYQVLIDAAIILYFIPFLYMFLAVIKLAKRKDRQENEHAVLIPGGKLGLWLSGGLGFVVVLIGIFVSLVPPGDSSNKLGFELKLVGGTLASILLGLVLYWRGARAKKVVA